MKNKVIKGILAVALSTVLALGMIPANANAESYENEAGEKIELITPGSDWEKLEITSAEDLLALSERCKLDTASDRLYVKLKNDISLSGIEFTPIPYFAGIFDGDYHTVSGLTCTGSVEPVGLFGTVGTGACVKNIKVSGSLQPSESSSYIGGIAGRNSGVISNSSFVGVVTGVNYVGGIAGINTLTGVILSCHTQGAVRGDNMTGGIAGINNGSIIKCENYALINTESVDTGIDVKNIDLELTLDLGRLTSQATNSGVTDMGGIAGYSSGTIFKCTNEGEVGYNHTGYNLGGIAGRSCGYIYECANKAGITGRKDVGGIVGQMEPFVKKTLSESQLRILGNQLEDMQSLMQKTQSDAALYSDKLGNRVSEITDSVTDAQNSASELTKATLGIESAEDINKDEAKEKADEKADDAKEHIKKQLTDVSEGNISVDDIESGVKDKANTAKAKNEKTEQELYDSLSELNAKIELLNKEAQNCSKTIDADLMAINSQYDAIQETISNIEEYDLSIEDTSLVDPDLITLGAVRNCVNEGNVEGDLNAGGIAGAMGEESSIDPEDEISLKIDTDTHTDYEYKAVLDACINYGKVYTKRNYVGGIAGRAEVGYIRNAESYGYVCTDGNYAGGIAATAQITIKDCFAKTTLKGNKYVGGIIADGTVQSTNGVGSIVSSCRALVKIEDAAKFFGAISGTDAGNFDDNIFVSQTLSGMGGVSITGKAFPVDYETLIAGENVPTEFSKLKLTFEAEGTVLKTVEFNYGDSFGSDIYPELPSKKGCFAKWDINDLTELKADTTVNAIYTSYISALTSEQTRLNKRTVFYVEGDFSDDQMLKVSKTTDNPYRVDRENTNAFFGMFFNRELEEQWIINIPDDGRNVHTLRYLPSDISVSRPELYVYEDGVWTKANPVILGSYYAFDVEAEEVQVAAVITTPIYAAWVLSITAVVVIVAIIIFVITATRSAKKKKAKKAEEKKELILKLAKATAEEGTQAIDENEELINQIVGEETSRKEKSEGKKLRRIIFKTLNTLIFAGVVALTVYLTIHPEVLRTKAAYLLASTVTADKASQFEVNADISIGKEDVTVNADVWKIAGESGVITAIESSGITLYKDGNRVYLENGKAFDVSEIVPDYGRVFDILLPEFRDCDMESRKVDGGTIHTCSLSGDAAKNVLAMTLGEYSEEITQTGDVSVVLFSKGVTVKSLEIKGEAYSESKERVSIDCVIEVVPKEDRIEKEVPKAVLSAIEENGEAAVFTRDMLDLLYSFGHLNAKDPSVCDIKINEVGNVISLSDSLSWYRTKVKGEWINCVSKNGISLYYTDKGACTAKGVSLTDSQINTVNAASILDYAYDVCLEGRYTVSKVNGVTTYSLELSDTDKENLMAKIAPELSALDVTITGGSITIEVANGEIVDIGVKIAGKAKLVILTKNFTVSAHAVPVSPNATSNYEIPTEVLNTLMGK